MTNERIQDQVLVRLIDMHLLSMKIIEKGNRISSITNMCKNDKKDDKFLRLNIDDAIVDSSSNFIKVDINNNSFMIKINDQIYDQETKVISYLLALSVNRIEVLNTLSTIVEGSLKFDYSLLFNNYNHIKKIVDILNKILYMYISELDDIEERKMNDLISLFKMNNNEIMEIINKKEEEK